MRWSVRSTDLSGVQGKEERVAMVPSFPACSAAGENCMDTGCCKVSGHTCFLKKDKGGKSMAQCNETCTHGSCLAIKPHSVPVSQQLGQKLYCFGVYTKNTGNTSKPNTELDLLSGANQRMLEFSHAICGKSTATVTMWPSAHTQQSRSRTDTMSSTRSSARVQVLG